jgi:hypothetical protein
MRLKHSFGSALKLIGESRWGNLSAYAKLALLTVVILYEPQWPKVPATPGSHPAGQQAVTRLIDRVLHR